MTTLVTPTGADLAVLLDEVWSTYIGEELLVEQTGEGEAARGLAGDPSNDSMLATVSIGGAWNGHLTIRMTRQAAEAAAIAMFELPSDQVGDAELADVLGEIANVVGGNTKAMLPEPSLLSLPKVLTGSGTVILCATELAASAVAAWRSEPIIVSLWQANSPEGS